MITSDGKRRENTRLRPSLCRPRFAEIAAEGIILCCAAPAGAEIFLRFFPVHQRSLFETQDRKLVGCSNATITGEKSSAALRASVTLTIAAAAGKCSNHMRIRAAAVTDLPAIQAIYAYHVLHGTGSFEEIPPSLEDITERFHNVTGHGAAWLVAEDVSGVLGYGYYGPFRPRTAYRYTVENSVYVREDVRRQGVGKAILAQLIEAAVRQGFRQMIAVIGDAENAASIGVHASLGFTQVARLRSCGLKFGRWLDCIYMQIALGKGASDIPSSAGGNADFLG